MRAGSFFVKTQNLFGEESDPIMLPEVAGIDPSFIFAADGKAYFVNNDDAPHNKPEYNGHRIIRIQQFDMNTDKTVGPRKIRVDKGARPEDEPIWMEGQSHSDTKTVGGRTYQSCDLCHTGG